MGGLSFKRLRLQGRIEGNVKRLKAQREKLLDDKDDDLILNKINRDASVFPPPAPLAVKRKRFFDLNDDGDEMVVKRETKMTSTSRKGAVRKLGYDFERVADDNDSGKTSKERSFNDGIGNDVMKIVEVVNVESEVMKKKKDELQPSETETRTRCSPRLAKRG
ncbi:uncharacterized protein LOC120171276 [Hibiscus syriacus]|uniref:uncharacterized protein LOC120171276 n=1 Tax=Hibiscus syriacus TaxID=106335 RepID=UPI001921791F|nr:uncharacterized protein LOC120171276 [Hibiscus syriacus]